MIKTFMVAIMNLQKLKLTRLMHRLLKHLRPGTVFVSKQVRVLAKLTL